MASSRPIAKSIALVGVLLLLAGCSPLCQAHLGIRPDAPPPNIPNGNACAQLNSLVDYSQNLQEAYHSRATQNRFWIYAAGTIGLATIAATGGLAAAGASTLTVTLVSTSGGFTSGVFALLDNATLADIYTISANHVADGLEQAKQKLEYDSNGMLEPSSCAAALATLDEAVTKARTDLERARTDSAVAALLRAKAQVQQLNDLLATAPPTPTATASPTGTPPTTSSSVIP